ncbi:endochitinase A [Physcomitrium patens]|uniref:Chitin-binding type-1 domain-containing protein n=1 Tax=Physcomitrium patens TaxID=3218 RepID=A0A2K1KDT1_PHYPA|nr:endochitinase-like [Physcomitrium patens]PNR51933.1 hypothetical protein PHYPA_008307 [Physcomitrium patens]|eukprot:XP_024377448.1 endochitinase-like [Physcomitrella patens]
MATAVARSIFMFALVALVLSNGGALIAEAQGECSRNSPCPNLAHCCSNWGYCGVGNDYCGEGCQGGPCYGPTPPGPSPPSGSGLDAILTRSVFENFFPGHLSFYSYDVLIEAAKSFPQFGTTGDTDTRKREIAAYAAHVKHETGGLTKITEQTGDNYCASWRPDIPCNGQYNGRGPLQLSWNYNYLAAGSYLGVDLINKPNLVATNNLIAFKTSLWFWMIYGDTVIPHIHDVMIGNWRPSSADQAANRVPGFGVTIDVINGGLECNKYSAQADARVNYYKDFCNRLNVNPGGNLDCKNMRPFYSVNMVAEA